MINNDKWSTVNLGISRHILHMHSVEVNNDNDKWSTAISGIMHYLLHMHSVEIDEK